MGYTDKLQKLCALRGLDQSSLASRLRLSKSSISRILSGAQEPKLRVAYELARELGVTLDYLVSEVPEVGPSSQLVMLTDDEVAILRIVRKLGVEVSFSRLLNVAPEPTEPVETKPAAALNQPLIPYSGARQRLDPGRNDDSGS